MKKHLLICAFAALPFVSSAQCPQHIGEVKDITCVAPVCDTRNVEVGNMFYYRPHGMFYSGWNRDLRNPFIAFVPINTDITFTADYLSGSPRWEYPDGKGGTTAADGESVTLCLEKGIYPAPRLSNGDDMDDVFFPTAVMEAGGFTRAETVDGVIMDACAVNYVPEGKVYTASNFLCTMNDAADRNLADVLKIDDIHVRGFGEVFSSPAKMTVSGFSILLSGSEDIIRNPQMLEARILVRDGSDFKELVSGSQLEMIVSPIEGLQGMYHARFRITDGDITVMPDTEIIPMVSTSTIKMTPMFDGQKRYSRDIGNVTTMFIDAEADGEQQYMQLDGFAINDGTDTPRFINSWCISLEMSYADSDPSGIDVITADDNRNNAVYNVMGVKVSDRLNGSLPSGIYVVNGRKIVF